MACGIPCVVTDAGDSALLVGDAGCVVPTCDPEALAAAWAEIAMSVSERQRLGVAARRRVENLFNLSSVVRRYQDLYEQIIEVPRRKPSVAPQPDERLSITLPQKS